MMVTRTQTRSGGSLKRHTDAELKAEFDAYVSDVVADKKHERYCELTRLAVLRHARDLDRQRTDKFPYHFDFSRGAQVCRFMELMPHIEGRWDHPNLYLSDWQIFTFTMIHAWRKTDGSRRFSDVYIEIGRKNAKSTSSAGLCLYSLIDPDDPSPLVLCAATTGDQANKVFNPALQMVKRTPAFRKKFGIDGLSREIRCASNGGLMAKVNSESKTQDGHNPSMVVFDELHAHTNRNLYDVLHSAAGARDSPLFITITTAGINYQGPCYEMRKLSENVLREVVSLEHHFAMIFTLDEGDDPYDEKNWGKANPQLYVGDKSSRLLKETLIKMAAEARHSQEREIEFKRKRMNIWIESENPYFDVAAWKKCAIEKLDAKFLSGLPCYGGLDLSSTRDFTAFALAWPDYDNDLLYTHVWLWLPQARYDDMVFRSPLPYADWKARGYFRTTAGNVIDHDEITRKIVELDKVFRIQKIMFDPWGATQTSNHLMNEGLKMVDFRQSRPNYNSPMKEFDRRIRVALDGGGGLVRHARNDTMTWMMGNVVGWFDNMGNVAPKRDGELGNIDGPAATLMAVGGVYNAGEAPILDIDQIISVIEA